MVQRFLCRGWVSFTGAHSTETSHQFFSYASSVYKDMWTPQLEHQLCRAICINLIFTRGHLFFQCHCGLPLVLFISAVRATECVCVYVCVKGGCDVTSWLVKHRVERSRQHHQIEASENQRSKMDWCQRDINHGGQNLWDASASYWSTVDYIYIKDWCRRCDITHGLAVLKPDVTCSGGWIRLRHLVSAHWQCSHGLNRHRSCDVTFVVRCLARRQRPI